MLGNIAFGKTAYQSTLTAMASYAVDGKLDDRCARTASENNPWWRVDLNENTPVMAVTVLNCCEELLENVEIRVQSPGDVDQICGLIGSLENQESETVFCPSGVSGRYVHITTAGLNKRLSLCEVKVYKPLGKKTLQHI